MTRPVILAAVLMLLPLGAAVAAPKYSPEQIAACKSDGAALCKDVKPGGGRIMNCLSKQTDKVSALCKEAIAIWQKK